MRFFVKRHRVAVGAVKKAAGGCLNHLGVAVFTRAPRGEVIGRCRLSLKGCAHVIHRTGVCPVVGLLDTVASMRRDLRAAADALKPRQIFCRTGLGVIGHKHAGKNDRFIRTPHRRAQGVHRPFVLHDCVGPVGGCDDLGQRGGAMRGAEKPQPIGGHARRAAGTRVHHPGMPAGLRQVLAGHHHRPVRGVVEHAVVDVLAGVSLVVLRLPAAGHAHVLHQHRVEVRRAIPGHGPLPRGVFAGQPQRHGIRKLCKNAAPHQRVVFDRHTGAAQQVLPRRNLALGGAGASVQLRRPAAHRRTHQQVHHDRTHRQRLKRPIGKHPRRNPRRARKRVSGETGFIDVAVFIHGASWQGPMRRERSACGAWTEIGSQ